LGQDNDKEIQLVRNNMKKLAINLDDKINRHVKSSTVNNEILCKEVLSELSVAKQEIDAFRQEVSKKNKEVQNCFSSTNKTELEARKKIAEKNEKVVELKKQTADITDSKSNQLGNNLCAATIRVQLKPTTTDVTSNTSESNASCVNDTVETDCSLGVHVSRLLYKSYNSRNYTCYFQQFKPECCLTEGQG
jgi:DNA helicase IV